MGGDIAVECAHCSVSYWVPSVLPVDLQAVGHNLEKERLAVEETVGQGIVPAAIGGQKAE